MKTKSEVLGIVRRQLDNCIGAVGSDAIHDTTDALNYYHGEPYGTETEGNSAVVTREVLETVEWLMPSLLRTFTSGHNVVMFEAFGPEDEAQAEQETDYITHVFLKDNDGWSIANNWMRSALIERISYAKVHRKTERKKRIRTYEGLSDAQLELVLSGVGPGGDYAQPFDIVVPLEAESQVVLDGSGAPMVDPMTNEPVLVHSVKVREVRTEKRICVEVIPREEMRISKDTVDLNLDEASVVAHVRDVTATELIEMGVDPDVVRRLPRDRSTDKTRQNINYARQVERGSQRTEFHSIDDSTALIEVAEVYITIDEDEDGEAELRRIVYAGSEILEDEEVDYQPFVPLCPIPQAHTHVGLGEADLVMDIQLIKSTLWRGMLDNINLTNNPEWLVVEDDINAEDWATSHPGRQKRTLNMDSVRPLTVPFMAASSMPLIEKLEEVQESRTGVTEQSKGTNADGAMAQSTLGAFSMGLNQGSQRQDALARTFAETGWSWLFIKLRYLVTRYQDRPRTVALRGKYVEIDPRDWRDRNNTTPLVGLGTGTDAQAIANLGVIAEKQEQHILNGSPMADFQGLYNTYERILQRMGFKDATQFWRDPASPEFQQALAEQQAQQRAEREQQAAQASAMADRAMALEESKVAARRQTDMERNVVDMQKARTDVERLADDSEKWRTQLEVEQGEDIPGSAV